MERKSFDEKEFIRICEQSSTMSIAAAALGMHFNTFKKHAQRLGCYKVNQGGRGTKKNSNAERTTPLTEILDGKHPHFQTYKLKIKLIKAGMLKNACSICNTSTWQGKELLCELDHIDGDRTNHRLENLRLLCPNCHSQTSTYRAKNKN